jgi:hypothetical protein
LEIGDPVTLIEPRLLLVSWLTTAALTGSVKGVLFD